MNPDHSTQPEEPDEVDIELDTLTEPMSTAESPPEHARGRPFAAFTMANGRVLELHVPSAIGCVVKGYSFATECAYILRNPDGSVEDSGSLGVPLGCR